MFKSASTSASFGNGIGIFVGDSIYDVRIDSNIIARNTNAGVAVSESCKGIYLTKNAMFGNGALGIDLDNNSSSDICRFFKLVSLIFIISVPLFIWLSVVAYYNQ